MSRSAGSGFGFPACPGGYPCLCVDERSLNRYFRVAEKVVWIDFGVFGLFKVGVQFHYLTDMAIGDDPPLVSEIPFHLIEEVNSVDQLYLALTCLRFLVRQDPDIGGDTGVEEQLIGQRDNALQPVFFDDRASDFALTAAGITRKEWRPVKDNSNPTPVVLHLGEHVLQKQQRPIGGARRTAENLPLAFCASVFTAPSSDFQLTPKGGFVIM